MKQAGNIHYQLYDDFNVYSARCRKNDLKGYGIIFDEETELMKDITERNKQTNVRPGKTPEGLVDEVCIEDILENEYLQKDPVRR